MQNDSSCSSPLFSSSALLAPSGNEVLCQQTRFDSNDRTPAITARLRVVWDNQRTIDNPDNALGMHHIQYHLLLSTFDKKKIIIMQYDREKSLSEQIFDIIHIPSPPLVILYSCSLLGTNCGQCLAQELRFECSYCVEGPTPPLAPGSCQFGATCSTGNGFLSFNNPEDVQNCPKPSITSVSIISVTALFG